MAGVGSRSELLNVLGEVKARVQDKLGIVDFPMPQFILIGKQSVGKSRLIEALAGETFNFISGTLGSRRPTVLEFRHNATEKASRWYVRDRKTLQWNEHPISTVMQLVGDAHEELGETVSNEPICVRIQSPNCVDMQMVDLPGFRDFALDSSKQDLCNRIEELVKSFMRDPRNVMLCVEQCGDAATMATLGKCREIDRDFRRTILVRTKLDKYFSDLTSENVNKWVDGFGDLPDTLVRFALTLPWWKDGTSCPKNFVELRDEFNKIDTEQMQQKQLRPQYLETIGFKSFASFMEKKIEHMFADAITPVLDNLKELKAKNASKEQSLVTEFEETDPHRILSTTRECGASFAAGLGHVMEGIPNLATGRLTLESELRAFHDYHQKLGSDHFVMLPSEDFCGLDDYLEYLVNEISIGAADAEVNGGAQFRRVMAEVEIFLRFSEIAVETKKRDVIQARGVSMSSLTWRDVVVKLLSNEAHLPLQRRVQYVGERIKWFFQIQKEAVIDFMSSLEGSPSAAMYPTTLWKHAKLIRQNEMIKHLVFSTYDQACARQLNQFIELFENMLTSTFANPWVFLKGATHGAYADDTDATLPSIDDTKERIPKEIQSRSGIETTLSKWLLDIPTEAHQIDEAVDKVQMLVLKTYSFIRSQVCDQVELFAESFFKLPMLRRLEEDMNRMGLSEQDKTNYQARRSRLEGDVKKVRENLTEVEDCIARLQAFKLKTNAQRGTF
eukprot:CAMPEP_0197628104 /NCGR_PEP_ID=MMETSP1338-20131121/6514_1 /TAXON_ID=43686 ORGANISM="Pelagodinium beii, Strain RCC1491" /NCGR_SAMPLE_ID=MMETSP1338 /ASSEMBLY_ACC=CAM_ASM_000754 /LENGTH=727 /DNA_ID=CAMNT_0043199007 /DNA_START=37 /DNA_END=2220 /DNA_ORIENTATION=+